MRCQQDQESMLLHIQVSGESIVRDAQYKSKEKVYSIKLVKFHSDETAFVSRNLPLKINFYCRGKSMIYRKHLGVSMF